MQVASGEFGGLPVVYPERRRVKVEDEGMEEGDDPLHVHHEPDSIVPDRDEDVEEEEGDISQESDSDDDDSESDDSDKGNEKRKARMRRETNSETSDSDSGVEDPTPASKEALYQMLAQEVEKRKKEARMRKEEAWISNYGELAVSKGKDQSYKELPKVKNSCGIRELYKVPEKNVIGPHSVSKVEKTVFSCRIRHFLT